MSNGFDPDERAALAVIEQEHPNWVVIWGYHSRLFWAFPRFDVPPGTIVRAASAAELVSLMRQTELSADPRTAGRRSAGPLT